jgi:anti-sigma factor RsiW
VIPLDPEGHGRVRKLLPWYVNGRLDAAERDEVESHLASCSRCRSELLLEHELHALHDLPLPEGDPDGRWAELRERIENPRPVPTPPAPRWPWWSWVLGAQSGLVVLLLVLWLLPRSQTAPYRGQGSAGSVAANAVVMFDPQTTETQWRQALKAGNARLVGGPTVTHGYLLHLPVADEATLAKLRTQPGVTLAEALAVGEAP